MKTYWGVEVELHAFLTSVLGGGEWSASCSGRFIPCTHYMGGWVESSAVMDVVAKRKIVSVPLSEVEPWLSSPLYLFKYVNHIIE
jgi:hypothetical protein